MTDDTTIDKDQDFPAKELISATIEEKMRSSYIDYAMSVLVSRALPDVRDGLKPVHRRILYAMKQAGNDYNKPFKKSARIVGDVLGKFHPHSQDAVYDTIVRLAQPFSMRYLLVDGQGNFGSVDGDEAAAMRYTEIRLTRLAHALMTDIDKETVDMMPNYDESELEPTVLSPLFPSLLVNGSQGIAVGMATKIPPHNLRETVNACLLLLDNPDATLGEVMQKIKAPDFPTAGIIHGMKGVREAYKTGKGQVIMKARSAIEAIGKTKREAIIVTELPYMVNKAHLIEHIANLVRDKKLEGISDLRDESDRRGMRIVIEIKRGAQADIVQNKLYKMTEMRQSFSVNMVALVDGVPRTLTLMEMLEQFLLHRREVVYRRSLFDLERTREKAHNLEGLAVAVSNVEEVIDIIKKSPSPDDAKRVLMAKEWHCDTVVKMLALLDDPELVKPTREIGVWGLQKAPKRKKPHYRLSDRQAQSILDMRLARLTALERTKIVNEYESMVKVIMDLLDILSKPERVSELIREELEEMKETFGDKRRTEIDTHGNDIGEEDLIEKRDMVVFRTHKGYVKAQGLAEFRTQHRGGTGKMIIDLSEDDFVTDLEVAHSHDTLLIFTSRGKAYWLKVYQLPSFATTKSRGRPIVNLLPLQEGETIQAVLPVKDLNKDNEYIVMATRRGIVKKTPLVAFSHPRSIGIIAINIDDGDSLINASLAKDDSRVMLFTDNGKAVQFESTQMRAIGRTARGVKGIKIGSDQSVVSMVLVDAGHEDLSVLTVTEKFKGKRTPVKDYRVKNRGIQGVTNISKSAATGKVVQCILVKPDDEALLVTDKGRQIRCKVSKIRSTGRSTQGVKIMDSKSGDNITGVCRIINKIDESTVDLAEKTQELPLEMEGEGAAPKAQEKEKAKAKSKTEPKAKAKKAAKPKKGTKK